MFLIQTEEHLEAAFRPPDRKGFEPPSEGFRFPLLVRDYFAWLDPSGVRVYLVFKDPAGGGPLGIAFRRDGSAADGISSQMCDWCHSYGSAQEIGLLTTEKNSRKRVGVILCRDLRCREKLEQAADRAGKSALVAKQLVVERMVRFAREGLGISPAMKQ